ncbi:hypothetical protein DICPUDRAFT_148208 [Dictyostelium purpureum]|uniref:PNPLA domain-containing protein n=1 Tax=Dictyostelium purpureum TaxID=5786 RepID=F0ZAJ3_DICPU|nr:uncharacterized protein DICPUDRAFT_148208 [Dictyostelium purpureum]EGC39084.1 hypothetical protein DICPUDRAFT_148208 [Dictyostelium purpureum]|eukprot:XP_003284434.1 hypothetical protein DICPUDRAFT_148208 [Dictyostelium purpureum]
MKPKTARIITLIYQIFSILGEIIILLLTPETEEQLISSANSSPISTPPPQPLKVLLNDSQITKESIEAIEIAQRLNVAISSAVSANALSSYNYEISKELQKRKLSKGKIVVVTLDGGGIRGIVTLTMLMELEKLLGFDIIDKSSLIGGTSTGSIIALGRSKGLPYSEILDIYKNFGKVIFKAPVMNFFVASTLANSDKKKEELQKVFGNTQLGDFCQHKKVFVVVSKVKSHTGSPLTTSQQQQQQQQTQDFKQKTISNYSKKWETVQVADALNASSAAPIFFKPVEILGEKYVDGGINYQNNPVLIAHKECQKLFGDKHDYVFISLGTGYYDSSSAPTVNSTNRLVSQAQETFKNAVNLVKNAALSIGDSETAHQIMLKQLSVNRGISYYRFNVPLSQNFSLSDASKSALSSMENETRAHMLSNEKMMDEIKKLKFEIETINNTNI